MNDLDHLYEADKHRIQNEAKVRTALEQPDFAEREFERWKGIREHHMEREMKRELENKSFVNAWAKVAWLAEGKMLALGREVDKLQRRIARQRRANREQLRQLQDERTRVEELREALLRLHNEVFHSDEPPTVIEMRTAVSKEMTLMFDRPREGESA